MTEMPGALYDGEGRCRFRVWAPTVLKVEVHLLEPVERLEPLMPTEHGYHEALLDGVRPGARYRFRLDGGDERPDPASRLQPLGVHGPSQVVDPAFAWTDGSWRGLPLEDYVLYELHVGTFSPEGTFEGVLPHLAALKDLGVTAIELMPVAQFPGSRNWGYDGVYPFAVQASYGGPDGLKRLIDSAHRSGLAVVLDVVYNHLGPEGNYLGRFGPYFTERYGTPWGQAINLDGPDSQPVRRFFVANATRWIEEFHVDALRLDAIQEIHDASAQPFLTELAEAVHGAARRRDRPALVIAESDLNDSRVVRAPEGGGFGHDAMWSDDFHHSLHALLTGERQGYYQDFGRVQDLAIALGEGWVYSGCHSNYRRRAYGNPAADLPVSRFVVCSQNHDQIGNRRAGERLSGLVAFEAQKLAATAVILSPYLPLLFMGEEYGETAPFQYFVSHEDPALIEAVRRGRSQDLTPSSASGPAPDPQDPATFLRSRLDHGLKRDGAHLTLYDFYRALLQMRRQLPALSRPSRARTDATADEGRRVLWVRRRMGRHQAVTVLGFNRASVTLAVPVPRGRWRRVLDTADARWSGPGTHVPEVIRSRGVVSLELAPWSAVVLCRLDS